MLASNVKTTKNTFGISTHSPPPTDYASIFYYMEYINDYQQLEGCMMPMINEVYYYVKHVGNDCGWEIANDGDDTEYALGIDAAASHTNQYAQHCVPTRRSPVTTYMSYTQCAFRCTTSWWASFIPHRRDIASSQRTTLMDGGKGEAKWLRRHHRRPPRLQLPRRRMVWYWHHALAHRWQSHEHQRRQQHRLSQWLRINHKRILQNNCNHMNNIYNM